MTSNRSFFSRSLFWGRFKRTSWMYCLASVALFFMLLAPSALTLSEFYTTYAEQGIESWFVKSTLASWLSSRGYFLAAITLCFAVVFGIATWNYLFSKRQVDFYHSLHYKRQTLFGSFFMAGAVSYLLPYVIMFGISTALVPLLTGISITDPEISTALINGFFRSVILYISVYSLTTLSCMLCGSLFVAFMGTGVFLVLPSVLLLLVIAIITRCLTTFPTWAYPIDMFFDFISPVQSLFINSIMVPSERMFSLYWLVASFIVVAFSLYLYKKRPLEAAGNAMVFKISRPLVKYPIVLASMIGFALLFEMMANGRSSWYIFGLIVGAFVSSVFIEMVYDFNVKSGFRNLAWLIAFGVVTCAMLASLEFDIIGYNTRLPDEQRLTGLSFSTSRSNEFIRNAGERLDETGYSLVSDSADYLESFVITDPEALEVALRLADQGVQNALYNVNEGEGGVTHVNVTFHEGDSSYSRSYKIYNDLLDELMLASYDDDTYRQDVVYGYLDDIEIDQYTSVYFTDSIRDIEYVGSMSDPDFTSALIDALGNDIANTSSKILRSEVPFMMINFEERDYTSTFAIYSDYTNTLSLLDSYDLEVPPPVTAEDIESISIFYVGAMDISFSDTIHSGYFWRGDLDYAIESYVEEYGSDAVLTVAGYEGIEKILPYIKHAYTNSGVNLVRSAGEHVVVVQFKDSLGANTAYYMVSPEAQNSFDDLLAEMAQ